jgi:hypothetical protein
VPISFLYLGALACLLFFLQTGEPHFFRLYAACLMLLPWAKREGAVLWFVAALWGAVIVAQRKRLIVSLPYLLPGLFVILGWREYLDSVSAAPPIDFLAVSLAALQANAGRALPIAHEVFTEMLRFSRWSLFWPLLAFSFASLLLHGRDRRLLVLSFAVGAPIAAYAATYFFSGWLDYHAHIHSSLARLLLQVVPAGWLVIALAFENLAARGFGFQPRDP